MSWFADNVNSGDVVVELGGHIGYLSLFFSSLVGKTGRVVVFEPGPNNLKFIRQNTSRKSNIEVRERAAGHAAGVLPLFVESLSGMNNSLVSDFAQLQTNAQYSGVSPEVGQVEVQVVRVDDEFAEDERIDLVKVDIEGFELEALLGMERILRTNRPKLLDELNRNHDAVASLLRGHGYIDFETWKAAAQSHNWRSIEHSLAASGRS